MRRLLDTIARFIYFISLSICMNGFLVGEYVVVSDDISKPERIQTKTDQKLRLAVICQPLPKHLPEPDIPEHVHRSSGISPDGNYIFIRFPATLLTTISVATGKLTPQIEFIKKPYCLSQREDIAAFYDSDNDDKYYALIDLRTRRLIKKIKLPVPDYCRISSSSPLGFSVMDKDIFLVVFVDYSCPQKITNEEQTTLHETTGRLLYVNIFDNTTTFKDIKLNYDDYRLFPNWILPNKTLIMCYDRKITRSQPLLVTFDGEVKSKFPEPCSYDRHFQVSKDGKLVLLSNKSSTQITSPLSRLTGIKYYVRCFDVETQKQVAKPFFLGNFIRTSWSNVDQTATALSDDKKLVAIYKTERVTIYDLKTGTPRSVCMSDKFIPLQLQFINRDRYLWVDCDNKVLFFDVQTGKELFQLIYCFNKERHWAIVAADGRYDGTKEALDNIKIKPNGRSDMPENYFSPKDKPNLYVDGLLATFFNAPMPDHYWFKTPEQSQPVINQQQKKQQSQQQKSSTLPPVSNTKTTIIPLPQIMNSK